MVLSSDVNEMIADYWLYNSNIKLSVLINMISKQIELGARDEDIKWLLTGTEQPSMKVWCFINDKWQQMVVYPDEFKLYKYTGTHISNIPVFELI